VVYSLCNDAFEKPFRNLFSDRLKLEGIEKKHVSQFKDKEIDYVALSKFAIDYSDGVIQSTPEVNPEIINYIKDNKVNFIPYVNQEDYADEYLRFYDTLM
jgi:starch synthase